MGKETKILERIGFLFENEHCGEISKEFMYCENGQHTYSFYIFLNAFTELEFFLNIQKIVIDSCLRDQDATTVSAKHI